MSTPSPSPSPKPSFRSRVGMVMRRSSLGLGTYQKSESKTSLSDSSTKGSALKVGTTVEPEITPHTVVSPVAESPAREAEASRPDPIVAPSPLGAIPGYRPEETPAPIPVVPSQPPAPSLPEPESQVVESPPSLVESPQAHGSALPVIEQVSGKLSDYVQPQPAVAKTPDMIPREVREEPDSIQPQTETRLESTNKDFGIPAVRMEEPEPKPVSMPAPEPAPVSIPTPEPAPVSIPTPEPAPAVIPVPEQQVPPPTQVVSDHPLLGSSVFAVPPEDHSPWAGVITRNDNLSSQPRTPPNLPRSLSPKQSRGSFAGTVFESVNGSQQSIPRQVSNKPSKASLAPSYTWSTKVDPQPKFTPQVVDHGTNGDARTVSSARYDLYTTRFISTPRLY